MKSSTVNIAFKDDLLKQIDHVAEQESRSRSELIREAARSYIERKRKWDNIFELGRRAAKAGRITEETVEKEIRLYRKENRK